MKVSVEEFQRVVEHAIIGLKSYRNPIEEHAIKACGKEQSPISLRAFAQDMLNPDKTMYSKMPLVCVKVLERYRSHMECFNPQKDVWENTPFTSYDRFTSTHVYRLAIEVTDAGEPSEETVIEEAGNQSSGIDMIEV